MRRRRRAPRGEGRALDLSPGRRALGRRERRAAGAHERDQRRGDAARARRGTRRARRARRVRIVVRRLRRRPRAPEARGHAAAPGLAVRAAEAHVRAVLPALRRALRARGRAAALLQRIRPAPGPVQRLCRRGAALRPLGRTRRARAHLRRRRADARLRVRRGRRARVPPRGPDARARRARDEHRLRRGPVDQRARGSDRRLRLDVERLPERKGEVRHSVADTARAKQHMGFRAEISLQEGLRRTVESFTEAERAEATRAAGPAMQGESAR